ncbi:hypothetical protein [Pseudomonas vanderleydeniana]|uniref:Type III secretion protein n=1 Tax=Pseudomonas vanderleydeniana TaxID=2745495 RepID=A0A9E6PRI0_9PSED|nr:hypothetical protein [Pseudomonas vanderleydeniana]QXI31248.1 hypothetical protein HU752_015515 [Pseudomonas vanderleydeniana]
MNTLSISEPQALAWVRWWVASGQGADTSWQLGRASLGPEWQARLRAAPPWVEQHLGLRAAWPEPPNPGLLPLLGLDAGQWQRVLQLAVAVCSGSQSETGLVLDEADRTWCRRLGRALQPGHWLPGHWHDGGIELQGLRLLRAWVGEPVWQRLRLGFARPMVEAAEQQAFEELPPARLNALWQAVGWYALTFITQGPFHVDPSQPELESSPGVA